MAKTWKPARPPVSGVAPTTITEIARRYYSCAVALAKVMGLPLTETFLTEHHAAIASCFIETSRCELRLPAGATLPPLAAPVIEGHTPAQGDLLKNSQEAPVHVHGQDEP